MVSQNELHFPGSGENPGHSVWSHPVLHLFPEKGSSRFKGKDGKGINWRELTQLPDEFIEADLEQVFNFLFARRSKGSSYTTNTPPPPLTDLRLMTSLHKTGSQRSNRKRKGLRMRSGSIGTNRVGLVFLIFTCSIGNQPFLVGIIDQLLQPTRNSIEMVENDGYRPLSQSWALIRYKMSTNKTVGVVNWCPLSPGIRPCFQPAEMRSISHFRIEKRTGTKCVKLI